MIVSELIKNLSSLNPESEILIDLWEKKDIQAMAESLEITLNEEQIDYVFCSLESRLIGGLGLSIDSVENLIYQVNEMEF